MIKYKNFEKVNSYFINHFVFFFKKTVGLEKKKKERGFNDNQSDTDEESRKEWS